MDAKVLVVTAILSILCYFLNLGYLVIFGSSILIGAAFSIYYPYVMALPSKYNMIPSPTVTSTIIITYAIGEGLSAAIVGWLMSFIHPIMLFVVILLLTLINWHYLMKVINKFEAITK